MKIHFSIVFFVDNITLYILFSLSSPVRRLEENHRMSDYVGDYTVELTAPSFAVGRACSCPPSCSVSVAVLNNLTSFNSRHQDILDEVLRRCSRASRQRKVVQFMWVTTFQTPLATFVFWCLRYFFCCLWRLLTSLAVKHILLSTLHHEQRVIPRAHLKALTG